MAENKKKKKSKVEEEEILLELDSMINDVETEEGLDEDKQRLAETLEQLKLQYRLHMSLLEQLEQKTDDIESVKQALDDACRKANGIVHGISNAIKSAETYRVKATLTDDAIMQIDTSHTQLLSSLKSQQEAFNTDVEKMFAIQRKELHKMTSNTEGVYLSHRLFVWLVAIWFVTEGILLCELTILIGNWIASW